MCDFLSILIEKMWITLILENWNRNEHNEKSFSVIQFRNTSINVKSHSDIEILIKVNMTKYGNIRKNPSDLG